MISFFYEGDLNRLGDGILIERRIRKTPFFSDFDCELYLEKKKYHASIRFPKYGGYEVRDIYDDKDKALEYFSSKLSADKAFLMRFFLRWILKLILNFSAIALIVFIVLMFPTFSWQQRFFSIAFALILEPVLYCLDGVLNRL